MFTDPVTFNWSCIHSVQQISVTPIVVDPISVADTLCERALTDIAVSPKIHYIYLKRASVGGVRDVLISKTLKLDSRS